MRVREGRFGTRVGGRRGGKATWEGGSRVMSSASSDDESACSASSEGDSGDECDDESSCARVDGSASSNETDEDDSRTSLGGSDVPSDSSRDDSACSDGSDSSCRESSTEGESSERDSSCRESSTEGESSERDSSCREFSLEGESSELRCRRAWAADAGINWSQRCAGRTRLRQGHALRLLLPCAGFDAPGEALRQLGIPYQCVGAWDSAAGPAKVLNASYPGSVVRRDMLETSLESLPDADGLVSGPPCPPWSAMGSRRGSRDARARVLKRVLEWITFLAATRKTLKFFVLENVAGICHKVAGSRGVMLDRVLARLRAALPESWHVVTLRMTSDCVAHHRPRVYIVGHIVRDGGSRLQPEDIPRLPRARLRDLLLDLPAAKVEQVLTPKQRSNLSTYLRRLAERGRTKAAAVFPVDRDPSKSRSRWRCDDQVSCLRHSAPKLWLKHGSVSRLLHPAELCRLQGFPPRAMPCSLSGREVAKGMGNAMSVPVVGAILHAVIQNVRPLLKSGRPRGRPSSSSSLSLESSSPEQKKSRR